MSSELDLPIIPTLPPISISSSADTTSGEKLETMHSSPSSSRRIEALPEQTQSNSSSIGLTAGLYPTGLRKSLSADSFVKYRNAEQFHFHGDTLSDNVEVSTTVVETDRNGRIRKDKARNRGGSLGAAREERGSSIFLNGVNEISGHPIKQYSQFTRKSSFRNEYTPYSRTLAKKSSSVTEATLSPAKFPDHAIHSSSQAHYIDTDDVGKKKAPTFLRSTWMNENVLYGRESPHSKGTEHPKRIKIDTEDLQLPDVTIAVVGPKGCGKSSFIYKAMKYYMSEPGSWIDNVAIVSDCEVPYKSRLARKCTDGPSILTIKILEVDSRCLINASNGSFENIWPSVLPRIDGIFVCYDASDEKSLSHIGELLRGFNAMRLPAIVLACKSDLEKRASPQDALDLVQHLAGIIEVSSQTPVGKHKMHKSFDVLMKAIFKGRLSKNTEDYRNPASPDVISGPPSPWDRQSSDANALTSSSSVSSIPTSEQHIPSETSDIATMRSSSNPTSPTRARSTGDLLQDRQQSSVVTKHVDRDDDRLRNSSNLNKAFDKYPDPLYTQLGSEKASNIMDEVMNENRESKERYPPSSPWATLEELLDKLFFLSVSGDDPAFISHFFLTYRRFATPRSVLLGMQKRMLELNQPTDDFMLASYAQMRLCHLLDSWIKEYPSDFAVPGTAGALAAFTRQTLSHTHTLHYGLDFLPFIEMLPTLVDEDAQWALEVKESSHESDESDGIEENGNIAAEVESMAVISTTSPQSIDSNHEPSSDRASPQRERRSSLPLTAAFQSVLQSTVSASAGSSRPYLRNTHILQGSKLSTKETLTKLVKVAQHLLAADAVDVAREITRIELDSFLKMKPRHWLRHTLVSGRKDLDSDPIARFHAFYNYVHDWTISLILCHDKPKARARQIEKFAEIANELRGLNNYSGLRAIVTAISNSTYPGDVPMEIFKARTELYKKFRSYDILLHSTGSHKSYRLALRNTKGPCIPALEVHMSDLLRAHEGNPDFKADDSSYIHWGKFNMIGKFIASTAQYQSQCRESESYSFYENTPIKELLEVQYIMDYDLQQLRISPPESVEGPESNVPTMQQTFQDMQSQNRDAVFSRRNRKFW